MKNCELNKIQISENFKKQNSKLKKIRKNEIQNLKKLNFEYDIKDVSAPAHELEGKGSRAGAEISYFLFIGQCLLVFSVHPPYQTAVRRTLNFKEERNHTVWLNDFDREKSKPAFHQVIAQYKY